MIDRIAERTRKLGEPTLRSIGDILRHQRLRDKNEELVAPQDMLAELLADNRRVTQELRAAHGVCDRRRYLAAASLIENWIGETVRRSWFLAEIVRAQ